MAIKKISEFVAGVPTSEDKILFEHNKSGKSATISDVGEAMGIHNYLPLSGGTLTGNLMLDKYLKLNAWDGYGTGWADFWYDGNNSSVEIQNATDLRLSGTKVSKEGHTHNYAGSSSEGGAATGSLSLSDLGILDTQEKIDGFLEKYKLKFATFKTASQNNIGFESNDGMIISLPWTDNAYGAQIAFDDSTAGNVKIRGKSKSWGSWKKIWVEGDRITGAVFNDLVDAIPAGEGDVLEAGYCYGFDGEHYTKTSEYMQKSYIGIHSDTYGFKMGHEEGKEKLNVAISGFVLAYVDKEYEVGTPLTCTSDGHLTEIKLEDKIKYPERVVATYWKNEPNEEWGPEGDKVKVNGRKWVKVK